MCAGEEEDEEAQGLTNDAAKDKKLEQLRQKKQKAAKLQKAEKNLQQARKEMEQEEGEAEEDDLEQEESEAEATDDAAQETKGQSEVEYPSYREGQIVALVDGNGKMWARAKILDPEPEAKAAKAVNFINAHWPLIESSSLAIVSNWETVDLFPYNKSSKPGDLGLLRADGSVFRRSMTPDALKKAQNFLVYVQGMQAILPKGRKAAAKPASTKAAKKRKKAS